MEVKNPTEPQEYCAAEKFDYNTKQKLSFLWLYIKTHVIILLLFIPETLKGIKNLFCPPKPKCIRKQVVLITGGGNGLGRALGFRFAQEGCKIAVVDIDFKAAQKTAEEIKIKYDVETVPFKVDVSNHEEINELKNKIENTLGSVDILVNNAGLLSLSTSLQEGTPEAIQNVVNVNLTSHFWTCRTFLNGMIKRKQGHVVAISSFAGKLTIPCSIAYCATKFGVSGFMDALFDELCLLEQDFVKTTTVYPLFINTRKELGDFLKNNKLLPRLEPDHAAHLIVKGILRNQRNIYIPKAAKRSLILNFFPDRIIRYVKVNSTDNSKIKKERLRMQAEILV